MNSRFDVIGLMLGEAIELYSKCPKAITVIRHADKTDDSEFHCIWKGLMFDWFSRSFAQVCAKRVFTVPRQQAQYLVDPNCGGFLAVRVRPQFPITSYVSSEYWLFASVKDPFGFLVPADAVELADYELAEVEGSD